jgi:hypothetical protein
MKQFFKNLFGSPLQKRAAWNMHFADIVIGDFTTTVDTLRQANEHISRNELEADQVIKEHQALKSELADNKKRNSTVIANIETFLNRVI